MNIQVDHETEQQITQSNDLLKDVLIQDLLGLYLYGSSIVGGLQKYSDIDLFVVSNRPTTQEEKTKIAGEMLKISGIYQKSTKKPVELTIVVKSDVNPWHYPPTFDFQYGDWLREEFEKGNLEPWDSKEMPDLAVLITQVLLASKTLYGPDPDQLLDDVPYHDFMIAATEEIDHLLTDLDGDTRNVLLTLARIWSTLETDAIRSKPSAAVWAIDRLPQEYQPVLQKARAICLGEENERWDDIKAKIKPCADFMVGKIKEQTSFLESSNTTQRSIHLGETVR
jgi:streptomycin 3"-adenylyltransferase